MSATDNAASPNITQEISAPCRARDGVYSMDVTSAESDLIDGIRCGKMPALIHDDPDYVSDATRDGVSRQQLRRERIRASRARDAVVWRALEMLNADLPGERDSGICYDDITETEAAVLDTLRSYRRAEISEDHRDTNESWEILKQCTFTILHGETWREDAFEDPEHERLLHAAGEACVAFIEKARQVRASIAAEDAARPHSEREKGGASRTDS
jgi:hypothetical protein